MNQSSNELLKGAADRWHRDKHGQAAPATLQALIKELIGHRAIPLEDFMLTLGVERDLVVSNAQLAYEDVLRDCEGARTDVDPHIQIHAADDLAARAESIRRICGLPPSQP